MTPRSPPRSGAAPSVPPVLDAALARRPLAVSGERRFGPVPRLRRSSTSLPAVTPPPRRAPITVAPDLAPGPKRYRNVEMKAVTAALLAHEPPPERSPAVARPANEPAPASRGRGAEPPSRASLSDPSADDEFLCDELAGSLEMEAVNEGDVAGSEGTWAAEGPAALDAPPRRTTLGGGFPAATRVGSSGALPAQRVSPSGAQRLRPETVGTASSRGAAVLVAGVLLTIATVVGAAWMLGSV